MSTIIHAGGVITPTAVANYSSTIEGGNIVHPILGRRDPDITLRPASLRTGTLSLIFDDETASRTAENDHATGGVFGLLHPSLPTVEMSYIVPRGGQITRTKSDSGEWILTVAFQEVSAP